MRKAVALEITQLSRDEKLELLDRLWESLGRDSAGKSGRELLQAAEDEALAEVDRLAEKIARAWRSPKSALELLDEQRR
jgi:hypothetical protein